VVQSLAQRLHDHLGLGEIDHPEILGERTHAFHDHRVVVAVQRLHLPAEGGHVRRHEAKLPSLDGHPAGHEPASASRPQR